MSASAIVVIDVAGQDMTQVPFSKDNDVVKALPADRADQALRVAVLPW
jgi:hypothetical protein